MIEISDETIDDILRTAKGDMKTQVIYFNYEDIIRAACSSEIYEEAEIRELSNDEDKLSAIAEDFCASLEHWSESMNESIRCVLED